MKGILTALLLLMFIGTVNALVIKVDVAETLKGNVSSFSINSSSNIVKLPIEFYDTGSVAYLARVRIYVYNDTDLIFSGWSAEKALKPGDRKLFDIFWPATDAGNYTAKLRIYFGNEIFEQGGFRIQVNKTVQAEDVFDVRDFKTHDDHVDFNIISRNDSSDAVVVPLKYTSGWVFEQAEVGSMKAGESKRVTLHYISGVWTPGSLKLVVASNSGSFYTEKNLEMKKETDLFEPIRQALCMIKICI